MILSEIYNKNSNSFDDEYLNNVISEFKDKGYISILPIGSKGEFLRWRWGYNSCVSGVKNGVLFCKSIRGGGYAVYQYDFADSEATPKSLWFGEKYDASSKGTNLLESIIPNNPFDFPKSLYTVIDNIKISSRSDDLVLDFFGGSGTTAHAAIDLLRSGDRRKYILVEMGNHFDTVLKPRIEKVVYSESWKDGKPTDRQSGVSQCVKYMCLESYEDTLNNLRFESNAQRDRLLEGNARLREDHILRYMLDVETKGSLSLLNIDAFAHPDAYSMEIKKPGSDSSSVMNIDLVETFNYLIGLRVAHYAAPQSFNAAFKRVEDPGLPEDKETRLVLDGRLHSDAEGSWTFRKIEGWVPANPCDPSDGEKERVLIVWRNLTGDLEKDNLMLDEWFKKNRISTHDSEFDTIYVNGSNNLSNLKQDGETWKVRLIEEEFMKRMWNSAD